VLAFRATTLGPKCENEDNVATDFNPQLLCIDQDENTRISLHKHNLTNLMTV